MSEVFVLYDIEESKIKQLTDSFYEKVIYFSANPFIKHCVGCFGCWVKTPGKCVIKDRGGDLPQLWASSSQVIIVSQLVYGGFSAPIKECVDRSLGYVLPYFRIVNGKMHHKLRYQNKFTLSAYFYGDAITSHEKEIATQLLKANAINYGAQESNTYFYKTVEEIEEITLCK